MLTRPRHMLMLAPVELLEGMSRIIHTANAFSDEGTKVTLVCGPQRNDNADQLKRMFHENVSVYFARRNDRQILHQRLAGKLSDEAGLPEVALYDISTAFDESSRKAFEAQTPRLHSKLIKKMPARLQRLIQFIFDEEVAAGHQYLREILPPHLYEKYKDLIQFYHYNYFFLIQALIVHKSIEPIDAIFCHDLWSLPIGCIMKELLGITLLYDSHELCTWIFENQIHRSIAIASEKWMYEMCDTFSTTSEEMAAYYRNLCPFLDPLVITNAHREYWEKPKDLTTLKERLSIPPSTPLAVFVGNLHSLSHIDRMIKAIASCRTNLHLAIVGDKGDIEKYKELCKNLDLEKRVFFLGRRDCETIFSTIYGADFGIIPNLQNYVNPPNVVLSCKLFDYVQVELPIISDLSTEIQKVVDQFRIGQTVDLQQPPAEIAKMLDDFYGRVMSGDFPADERKRARDCLVWPKDTVDQILSGRSKLIGAQAPGELQRSVSRTS